MTGVFDWLVEPWRTELVARAGLELLLVGVLGGALGVFVVMRGLSFATEAFAHTVFPGAVVAAAFGGSIVAGGLVAGLAGAVAVVLARRVPTVSDDTAIGVVFTGMFALGAILLSVLGPLEHDVASFLFGNLLGISSGDLVLTAVATVLIVGVLVGLRRSLVTSTFDRDAASAGGVRVELVDAVVLLMLAVAVVVGMRAVGNVLMVAVLVIPAATARLVAGRVGSTIAAATAVGALTGLGGLYLSYYAEIAAGGAVVLVAVGVFAVVFVATSPLRRVRGRPATPSSVTA